LNKEGLPDGWELVKIKDVAEIDNKIITPDGMRGEFQNYIGLENIESNTGQLVNFSETSGDGIKSNKFQFTKEHILYGKLRPYLNKVYLPNFTGVCSTDIIPIKPDSNLLTREFLGYFLRTPEFVNTINTKATGANLPRVYPNTLLEVSVPLPPLDLQRKIVAILDKAEATQRLRAEADALMQDLVQSVFLEMFGDPATNPKQWDILTIGDVVEKTQYGTSQKSSERGGGYPCLGMNNLTYKGHFDLSHLKYVELSENEFRKYKLEAGDILFNRTNAPNLVGKTGVITKDTDCVFASYLIRLKVNTQIIVPEYLWAYLNSPFIKQTFTSMCKKAVNQANINATELQRVSIPIPPIDMQKVFAKSVRNLSGFKNITGESSKELLMLQNILMSKAFTGDLIA